MILRNASPVGSQKENETTMPHRRESGLRRGVSNKTFLVGAHTLILRGKNTQRPAKKRGTTGTPVAGVSKESLVRRGH